jgi:hypothetical protein
MWSGLQRVRPRGSKYPCCQSCCRFRSRSRVGYVRRFVPWTVKSNVLSSMTGVRRLMRFLCIWILTLDVFNFAIVFSRHFSTTGTGTARGGEELATCLFAISLLTWSDTNFIYILVPKWLARDGCGHAHVSCTCLYFYLIVCWHVCILLTLDLQFAVGKCRLCRRYCGKLVVVFPPIYRKFCYSLCLCDLFQA